jgi:Ni/Co efflux regulator RcnB
MTSKSFAKTFRQIGVLARAGAVAMAACSVAGSWAVAAAPDAHKQIWQPQVNQQQQQRQRNNRSVNQIQPQQNLPQNLRLQPQPRQQLKPLQQPRLQTRQPLQSQPRQQQQVRFQHFDWNTYRPGQRPPLWQQYRVNFDPRPYQWNRNAPRIYYVPVYVPPPNWRYRRWSYGQILPPPYWARPYWLTNYWNYGLEPPPYGYVWVRNGPDALAVDIVTGVILSVVYGLFSSSGGGLF